MSVMSVRFKRPGAYEQLKECALDNSVPISSLAERFIEEGLRMERHPGIVFRSGPAGRRAGLAAGPDVWEIIGVVLQFSGSPEEVVLQAAESMGLVARQVKAATRYYAEFTDEIDDRIAANHEAAEREHALWLEERRLLSG